MSQVKTKGGDESADITYDDNPETAIPSDPANSWHRKAVYTSNDGTVKTVYSSKLGADMLVVDTDGTDTWIYYIEFDSDGRPIAHYSPAAIDMTASPIYDEDDYDLSVAVKTDAGRIDVTRAFQNYQNRSNRFGLLCVQFLKGNKLMSQRSHSADAEFKVGPRMEPEFELTDDQWDLISDLFDDPLPSPLGGRPRLLLVIALKPSLGSCEPVRDGVTCLTVFHRTRLAGVD